MHDYSANGEIRNIRPTILEHIDITIDFKAATMAEDSTSCL